VLEMTAVTAVVAMTMVMSARFPNQEPQFLRHLLVVD
jgi:hypothetical protein